MSFIFVAEQILNGLQFGVMLFLMAAGLTLIFGVMGLINLAHGALYMVGAFIAAAIAKNHWVFFAGIGRILSGCRPFGCSGGNYCYAPFISARPSGSSVGNICANFDFFEGTRWIFGSFPLYLDIPTYLTGPVHCRGITYPLYRIALILVTR